MSVRFCLPGGELQQIQRALHIHVMRGHRGELGARRQQRCEMEDEVYFKLGEDPLEDAGVQDGRGKFTVDEAGQALVQGVDVQRDHRQVALLHKVGDQSMAYFAVCARDQDDWLPHSCYDIRCPWITERFLSASAAAPASTSSIRPYTGAPFAEICSRWYTALMHSGSRLPKNGRSA